MKNNPARKHFAPLISAYIDGELSPEERQEVEKHLAADKDSAAMVADFRAGSGLMRLTYEELAEKEDFSNFSNEVMAKLTPHKLPLLERLKLSLSEMFTYQRNQLAGGFAVAAALALVAVVGLRANDVPAGYANPKVEVQTVSVEQNSTVRPVVMETDKGDAIIWMVEDAPKKKDKKNDEEKEEELGVDPSKPPEVPQGQKAGDL